MSSILIVDDEASIQTLVSYHLTKAGYDVEVVDNGLDALKRASEARFDLVILDLMLPGLEGSEVCKQLRQRQILTPIIMLTAKDEEIDKILGLELGADDYITKPFSSRELVARVKAHLRRTALTPAQETGQPLVPDEELRIGKLHLKHEKREVYFDGRRLDLTPKEYELLYYLMRRGGRVLSREQLLNAVWDYDFAGDTRIVDVHVSHLREKIELDSRKPTYIKTVRGVGYKLEGPEDEKIQEQG